MGTPRHSGKSRKTTTVREPSASAADPRGEGSALLGALCGSPGRIAKACAALKADELQLLHRAAGRELEARKDAARPRLMRRIREMAQAEGFSVTDLLLPYRGGGVAPKPGPVTYQHPARPELIWRGRGRRPQWLRRWVASGRPMSDLIR